jgi:hypothetical protein
MRKVLSILVVLFIGKTSLFAQVKIGDNSDEIYPQSLLELESTTKGLVIPRMTSAQRDAAFDQSTPLGMIIFNIDENKLQYFKRQYDVSGKPTSLKVWEGATDEIVTTSEGGTPTVENPGPGDLFYNEVENILYAYSTSANNWMIIGNVSTSSINATNTIFSDYGTSGQILSSTGTTTVWIDPPLVQQGPQGDPGPAGERGPAGENGQNGAGFLVGVGTPTASVSSPTYYVNTATGDQYYNTGGGSTWTALPINGLQNLTASVLSANNTMTLSVSNGNTVTLDFSSLSSVSNTDSQTINAALVGTDLQLSMENTTATRTVDLSSLTSSSGTDSQTLTASLNTNSITIAISGGNTQTVDLSSIDTDEQDIDGLAFDNSTNVLTVGITGGSNQTIDLSDLDNSGTDSQTINAVLVGTDLQLSMENTTATRTVDLSSLASGSGTDSQTLTASLNTNSITIAISGGNTQTVDLSSIDTDEQDINGLVFNSATNSLTVGITGGSSQTIDLSDLDNSGTDDQTLAEVTAQGSVTTDAIQVGGVFDSGDLTVIGESSLQGNVRLGVFGGVQTLTVNALVDTNLLFFGPGRDIASTATPVTNIFGDYIKPGSGNDLDLDTNNSSNRITFSNSTNIKAGVNSSTLFVGDDAGPSHYKFPSGTASRSPGQVLSLDTTTEQLTFTTLLNLPTATNDGATLRWDTTANEWQESTDLRIAPNSSSEVWINQSLLPSSTLLDIGQSGNNFDEVFADQLLSSQTSSVTFGTNNGSNKVYLKFEGDPPGSIILNESATSFAGQNNTAFGFRTLTNVGSSNNNNVAVGNSVLNGTSVGTDNVGVGYNALAVSTSSANVAVGSSAMAVNTLGTRNVAVGANALTANTQGQYNTAIGYNSMDLNTSGESNTAIGINAMDTNTTGQENTMIGAGADVGASDLQNATAIGFDATVNASNTIRLGNTNVSSIISSGTLTLDGVTYPNATGTAGQVLTVSSTTDILYFADASGSLPSSTDEGAVLRWNTTTSEWESTTDFRIAPGASFTPSNTIWINKSMVPSSTNINLGQSGNSFQMIQVEEIHTDNDDIEFKFNTDGTSSSAWLLNYNRGSTHNLSLTDDDNLYGTGNSAFGIGALRGTLSGNGEYNSTFGYRSLKAATNSTDYNAVFGANALFQLNNGSNNVAMGYNTFQAAVTGSYNVAIGSEAGRNMNGASNLIAIGYEALKDVTNQSNNIAVGAGSLKNIESDTNVAVGSYAGLYLEDGSANVAIGHQSLRSNSGGGDGDRNVAVGYAAMFNNYDASNNVALGYKALYTLSSGQGNVAIGSDTATSVTSGNNNIAIGTNALDTNTAGSGNIAIGNNADVGNSNLSNAIAIGQNAQVSSSNSIRLGDSNVSSIISSATLTLDEVTYPNTVGTAGQVLTVSSTLGELYFADAAGSSSPYYFLASNPGGQIMANGTALNNFSAVSSNGITIASGQNITLPQGRIYELSAAINIKDDSTVGFGFYDGTNFLGVNGISSKDGSAPLSIPARAIIDATSSSITITLTVKSVVGSGIQVQSDGTHIFIKEL